jgi:hypothetical protein
LLGKKSKKIKINLIYYIKRECVRFHLNMNKKRMILIHIFKLKNKFKNCQTYRKHYIYKNNNKLNSKFKIPYKQNVLF